VIVCDTGPLVAAALSNDADHQVCVDLFSSLHAAGRQMLVPAPVVAEVGYLLAREAGTRVESLFLRSLSDGDFLPVELTRPAMPGWRTLSSPTPVFRLARPTRRLSPSQSGSS